MDISLLLVSHNSLHVILWTISNSPMVPVRIGVSDGPPLAHQFLMFGIWIGISESGGILVWSPCFGFIDGNFYQKGGVELIEVVWIVAFGLERIAFEECLAFGV